MEPVEDEPEEKPVTALRRNPLEDLGPLSFRAAKILISTIHAWHLEANLDQFLLDKLNLKIPRWEILFGLIRHNVGMLYVPSEATFCQNGSQSNFFSAENRKDTFNEDVRLHINGHWTQNEDMSNIHLVAITSLSNAIMSLPEDKIGGIQGRQCWSNLITLHCALLPGND